MPFMERGTLLNPPKMDTFREQLYHVTTSVEDYRATGVPTLLITSDEDILSWPELSEMVHSKMHGSRLLKIPGAGHSVYFEKPDLFNREVNNFLREHKPL